MIHSMTAFSRSEKKMTPFTVVAMIHSYNSRHLDVALKIPYDYQVLEEKIKAIITKWLTRGRIEITIKIKDDSQAAASFKVDINRATAYYKALEQVKKHLNMDTPVSLELLAGVGGIIEPAGKERDMAACWEVTGACIHEALKDLIAMRKREGDSLRRDLASRIDTITGHMGEIEKASDGLLDYYQQRLMERIAMLTQGKVELDPGRIAEAAAFLSDKSDISEEQVRVASHIHQFRDIMVAEEPSGRKLNFLIQELNREFNTIGSKTAKAEVSHRVIELKTELEKIREQIQNIE